MGDLVLGIDFKSGTRIQTAFIKPVSVAQIRSALTSAGYGSAEVQGFTSKGVGGKGFQITTEKLSPEKLAKVKGFGLAHAVTAIKSATVAGPTPGRSAYRDRGSTGAEDHSLTLKRIANE